MSKYSPILVILALTALFGARSFDPDQPLSQLVRRARSLERIGKLGEAAAVSRRAVQVGLDRPEAAVDNLLAATDILGRSLYYLDSVPQAESVYVTMLDYCKRRFGEQHPTTADALVSLATFFNVTDQLPEAEQRCRQAIAIERECFGDTGLEMVRTLGLLSTILWKQNRGEESLAVLAQSQDIVDSVFGAGSCWSASLRYQSGDRYFMLHRLCEADSCLNEALGIFERFGDESTDQQVRTLDLLGKASVVQGRYEDAEQYLTRACELVRTCPLRRRLGLELTLQNNVGNLYIAQGRYEAAFRAYDSALTMRRKREEVTGQQDPHIAEPLNNLGELCYKLGRYEDAETYLLRAYCAREDYPAFGPRHPTLVYSLLGLGHVYTHQGRIEEADSVLRLALSISRDAYGRDHLHVAWELEALGDLALITGDCSQAEDHYLEALAIRELLLGTEHPEIADCLGKLARTYALMGDEDRSLKHYWRTLKLRCDFNYAVFSFASEQQKMRYVSMYPLVDHSLLSYAARQRTGPAVDSACAMIIRGKGIVVEAMMAERAATICSFDTEVEQLADSLTAVCNDIAGLVVAGMAGSSEKALGDSLAYLYHCQQRLERDLSSRCQVFAQQLGFRETDLAALRRAIPRNAVLCEYVKYTPHEFSVPCPDHTKPVPDRYLVFMLPSRGDIGLVDLGNADAIDKLVRRARGMLYRADEVIALKGEAAATQALYEATDSLYRLVFEPLTASLGDNKTLLISPDGELSLLPFEVLPVDGDRYVVEDYSISYVSSSRDLPVFSHEPPGPRRALLIADPDFDSEATVAGTAYAATRGTSQCLDQDFPPLRFAGTEVSMVTGVLEASGSVEAELLVGADASEKAVKSLGYAPDVLHLSTHGFFCDNPENELGIVYENPLLRCGLALAGANLRRIDRRSRNTNGEDGILTALEISNLNLLGTELAVLSACETGVGDVHNGEGVFGLRRAFQHAGVSTMLMSLWVVPDSRETCDLMAAFYRNWLGGMAKREALRRAALEVIDSHREENGVSHPYYWGGFVLVGDPR